MATKNISASFADGTGIANDKILTRHILAGNITEPKMAAGAVVQTVYVNTTEWANGSSAIPFDNTVPQISEGTEFMTRTITPKNANNILLVTIVANLSAANTGKRVAMALFQDAVANALAVNETYTSAGTEGGNIPLQFAMVAGTTSQITFRLRAGTSDGTGLNFNGCDGSRKYGATVKSTIIIQEIKV